MGTGFIQFLNDYRLEIAAKLLLSGDGTVLDAAMQSGFENLSYFTRSFKKKYGVTPGKYRKE
jgi:AraC-like DNA-binding protein